MMKLIKVRFPSLCLCEPEMERFHMRHCDVLLLKAPTIYSAAQYQSVAASFFRLNDSMGSLGLVMLATVLDDAGYETHVCYPRTIHDVGRLVRKYRPRIIGVSSETMNFPQASKIPALVDSVGYDIFKVIGGYHATFEYEESLRAGYDCVVIGEGEETFLELVCAVCSHWPVTGVRGIAYLDSGGRVVKTPSRPMVADLDLLPLPRW